MAKSVAGRDIKFLRCAFKDGASKGNNATLTIGTNDQLPGASRILLEDSWSMGRVAGTVVVQRRKGDLRWVVVRHDGAAGVRWPQSTRRHFYLQHAACGAQNVLLIDNDLELPGWEAALYLVRNPGKGTFDRHVGTRIRGSMVFNTRQRAIGASKAGDASKTRCSTMLIWCRTAFR